MVNGEEAVKSKTTVYLPQPEGMEDSEYLKYLQRAEFFNATGRTLDGLFGQIGRKRMVITVPKEMEDYLLNVDGKGHTFEQFALECAYQTLKTGWGGILVDAPNAEEGMSKAEAQAKGIYPFMSYVSAQSLYAWHYDDVNRVRSLVRAGIKTVKEYPSTDPFTYNEKTEYKLLYIDNEGNYTVETRVDGLVNDIVRPTKKGQYLKEIPLVTIPNSDPENSLLKDLANVNLSWFRKSADLENGLHWTGVPTPYILGYEPETKYDTEGNELPKDPIYLGGSSILCLPTGTNIGYLEFVGSGLSQLRQGMQDDEDRMAILGARIISAEKRGVESAETARIHRAGENSVLANFAMNLSDCLKKVLKIYLEWITETDIDEDKIDVKLNTDYDISKMSPSEIQTIVSAWQSGLVSKRVAFDNLQEGEVIPADTTFEEQEELIQEEREKAQALLQGLTQ